jgi:hypothetical protein
MTEKQPHWKLTPDRKKSIFNAGRTLREMIRLGKVEYYKRHPRKRAAYETKKERRGL